MLVDRAKMESADQVSKEVMSNPNYIWKCFKKLPPDSRPASNINEKEWINYYSGVFSSKNLKLEIDSETSLKCKLLPLQKKTFLITPEDISALSIS